MTLTLTHEQQVELLKQKMSNEQDDKLYSLAFKLLIIFAALFVVMLASSIVLHIIGYPELRDLSLALSFVQSLLAMIVGFFVGTKSTKK
jgi:hydrogenase-4 membrane subunit HyfE